MFYRNVCLKCVAALLALFVMLLLPRVAPATEEIAYIDNEDGITLVRCPVSGDTVTVPSCVDGKPVTALGEEVFNDLEEGVAVWVPACVTRLENNPFVLCRGKVRFEEGSPFQVESGVIIEKNTGRLAACLAFDDSITVPEGVTEIGARAFYGLPVRGIILPDSVHAIGEAAFGECAALESIALPSAIRHLPPQAFIGCAALKNITLPDSLVTVGDWCFAKSGLTSVILPEGVTEVGKMAFLRCTGLIGIDLPFSLDIIPESAFDAVGEAALFTVRENSPAEQWAKENGVRYQYAGL